MDPERVRAYLQVACAGLGFDIGEVWWTSNENGSSTVAAIEEPHDSQGLVASNGTKKKFRFVQLYTSKSYESRRSELINPPDAAERGYRRGSSTENLEKHKLSPQLVDAISKTTQVVWANTKKQEGLTGRSDICLQTAVGMPVAVDGNGNMCIVVMFSPNNIQSTDEALEYLQSISMSATSSDIPCLLPVFDPHSSGVRALPASDSADQDHPLVPHPDPSSLGDGVTARFVSLDESHHSVVDSTGTPISDEPEVHSEHELSTAPKDTFGIPMLPSFAEFGNVTPDETVDIFDEASYGIWTTVMDTQREDAQVLDGSNQNAGLGGPVKSDPALQVILPHRSTLSEVRHERLEEFCEAFLDMSVFDLADVWVPATDDGYADCLRHVMSISSTNTNERLDEFKSLSENALIKFWTGAVGRAYSSGNPVWSANPNVFVDPARAAVFEQTSIKTVLAVPVFSGKDILPACVVTCYSLVHSGSVPFVLRFVQQALRLLWEGLHNVEPHESVDKKLWRDVAPADLGEMAADIEMQQHFIIKKRPHNLISSDRRLSFREADSEETHLSSQMQSIQLPNGDTITIPLQFSEEVMESSVNEIKFETVQNHVTEAVRSVGNAAPFEHFEHLATNSEGTKRAHVMGPIMVPNGAVGTPLAMPRGFPDHVISREEVDVQQMTPDTTSAAHQAVQQQSFGGGAVSQSHVVVPIVVGSGAEMNESQFCQPVNGKVQYSGSALKICRIQGCERPATSRRPYCEKHCGNRHCEHPGCTKCAQGSTRFCIAHGGGRRCTFPGCDKGARDKLFCAAHGGGKRCQHEGCTKSAVGGSNLCTAHGGGRRCAVEGCDKSAQSSTKFCVKHGGGKKCAHEGCTKVARGRTLYCAAHGGGVRCKLEGCNRVAIGKMQLCRAHGGFSSRSRKNATSPLVPAPQLSTTLQQPVASQPDVVMEEASGVMVD